MDDVRKGYDGTIASVIRLESKLTENDTAALQAVVDELGTLRVENVRLAELATTLKIGVKDATAKAIAAVRGTRDEAAAAVAIDALATAYPHDDEKTETNDETAALP